MKIDNLNSVVTSSLNSSSSVRSNKTSSINDSASVSSEVRLSEYAQEAQSGTEIFDSEKVSRIKAAIAEGRFTVNANAVADSLISTAKDLILTQSRSA